MSETRMKWGMLGTSEISATMASAIQESTTSQLVAIASRSQAKAKQFAEQFSIKKYYDNYQALLKDADIDVIYIGLPNHLHKEWIVNCALAGKHMLCEKPLITNEHDALEAYATVRAADVICVEALMYRYHPFIEKLTEMVKNKVVGDLRLLTATYTVDISAVANPTAGGSILNLGCYPVSLIRLLVGQDQGNNMIEPTHIISLGRLNQQSRDNQASVLLKFDNQIMAVVNTADDFGKYAQFDIYGTEGHLHVLTNPWLPTRDNNKIRLYRKDQEIPVEINVTADKSLYTYQIDAVNKAIMQRDETTEGVVWQNNIGNMIVLDTWLRQINDETEQLSQAEFVEKKEEIVNE